MAFAPQDWDEKDIQFLCTLGTFFVTEDAPEKRGLLETVYAAVIGHGRKDINRNIAVKFFVVPQMPEDALTDLVVVVRLRLFMTAVVQEQQQRTFLMDRILTNRVTLELHFAPRFRTPDRE